METPTSRSAPSLSRPVVPLEGPESTVADVASTEGAQVFSHALHRLEDDTESDLHGWDRSSVLMTSPGALTAEHVRRYIRQRHEPEPEDYFFRRHVWLYWWWDTLIFKLRSWLTITLTLHTLFSIALSIGVTVLFHHYGWMSDMPTSLLAAAVFFPLSFGIGFNLSRRESMLKDIGLLRALLLGLWWGARDWISLGDQHERYMKRLRDSLSVLLVCIRQTMLHNTPPGGSNNVYRAFDDLAHVMREMEEADRAFYHSGMDSRWQQYFKQSLESFERIRVNHDYRTPSSLRGYSFFYLSLYPLLFAPLFANYAKTFGLLAGCYSAGFSSVLLTGLYRIYANEEDPLDGTGQDDLSLESLTTLTDYMFSKRSDVHHRVVVPGHARKVARVNDAHLHANRGASAPSDTLHRVASTSETEIQSLKRANPIGAFPQYAGRDDAAFLDLRSTAEYPMQDLAAMARGSAGKDDIL